jgi:hypothetical protein
MKLKDFAQEAAESLGSPPEGSFNKNDLHEMMGVEDVTKKEVHAYIKKAVNEGQVIYEGSWKVKGEWNRYYSMVE